jgi:hypothetical protein
MIDQFQHIDLISEFVSMEIKEIHQSFLTPRFYGYVQIIFQGTLGQEYL